MNKLLKMCMNWKVLVGIAAVVLVVAQFVPGALASLPLLLFLVVCPLMMFLMMRGMPGMAESGTPPAAPSGPPAPTTPMAGGIADLKAAQESLQRQITALEAGAPPADPLGTAPVIAPAPRR